MWKHIVLFVAAFPCNPRYFQQHQWLILAIMSSSWPPFKKTLHSPPSAASRWVICWKVLAWQQKNWKWILFSLSSVKGLPKILPRTAASDILGLGSVLHRNRSFWLAKNFRTHDFPAPLNLTTTIQSGEAGIGQGAKGTFWLLVTSTNFREEIGQCRYKCIKTSWGCWDWESGQCIGNNRNNILNTCNWHVSVLVSVIGDEFQLRRFYGLKFEVRTILVSGPF